MTSSLEELAHHL
jgi:hypothetical protein